MKAYLSAVLEDLVGEYVLNITKDNLRLAALRGNIKLENVDAMREIANLLTCTLNGTVTVKDGLPMLRG